MAIYWFWTCPISNINHLGSAKHENFVGNNQDFVFIYKASRLSINLWTELAIRGHWRADIEKTAASSK